MSSAAYPVTSAQVGTVGRPPRPRALLRTSVVTARNMRWEQSSMKRWLLALLLPVVWASLPMAQNDVEGTWRAEGQPSMPWTFALSVNGTTVTGTATMTGAAPAAIVDGRTDGRTVSFRATSADGDRTVIFTGTWDGEALSFTREVLVRAGGSPGGNGLFGANGPPRFIARRVSR